MHQQPSSTYAYCLEIQNEFFKTFYILCIQTFYVFPSLLVM